MILPFFKSFLDWFKKPPKPLTKKQLEEYFDYKIKMANHLWNLPGLNIKHESESDDTKKDQA